MPWARTAWGRVPWGRPDAPNVSVVSDFATLVQQRDADAIFLAILRPVDPASGNPVELVYGDAHFAGPPAAPIRLDVALEIDGAIFDGFSGLSGASYPRLGGIRLYPDDSRGSDPLAISPSDLDALAGYWWDGREIEVLMGGPGFSFGQFQPVFIGRSADAEWSRDEFQVIALDPVHRLRRTVQETRYAGTGGLEGGSNLDGKTKPLTFGYCPNVAGERVDETNEVYHWHDRLVQSITNLRDDGAPLISDGDVADVYAWSPVSGHYVTDVANGIARLGATAEGTITADIEGDADASLGGYVETAADVFRRIAEQRGEYTAADFDLASFAALNVADAGRIGVHIPSGAAPEIPVVLDQILPGTILGTWETTRLGDLRVVRIEFRTPVRTIRQEDVDESTVRRLGTPVPDWRRTLLYGRAWEVQTTTQLATGDLGVSPSPVTDAEHRAFVGQAYRRATSEDATVKTDRNNPGDPEIATLYADQADAAAEVARQLALTKVQRDRYELEVRGHQFLISLGDTIRWEWPLWGLSAGKDFIVIALKEDTGSRMTKLTVWG